MATMTGHRRWILLWALSALAPATPALGQSGTPTPQRPAAPASKNIAPGFIGLAATDKLLLMPIDVELFSISAGVRLRGIGGGAVRNGELFAITYTAPRLAFYPAGLPGAEAIAKSARLRP